MDRTKTSFMKKLGLLLLLSVFAVPQVRAQEEPAPADLSMFVFDDELPLSDVTIKVDGRPQAVTNDNGAAWLLIGSGKRKLTLEKPGRASTEIRLKVGRGENLRVITTLKPEGGKPEVDIQSSGPRESFLAVGGEQGKDGGPTGTLQGRVVSAEDGGPVSGARVFISGTPVDMQTDKEGRFRTKLPEGTYSLSVIHGDYSTQTKDGIKVGADKTAKASVELTPAGLELQDFVVTVPYIEGSVASTLSQQEEASGVTEVLGADQMSRAGDSDAADALARVTGLTIEDGKYVVIRGQPARYTATVLNGSPLPSPDPMRRIVPLDLFPTGVLSAIEVQKSYTSDQPGTFGAGLIDLRTRGLPESGFGEIEIGAGLNTQSFGEKGLTYEGGGSDWRGVDDGSRSGPSGDTTSPVPGDFGNDEHVVQRESLGPDRSLAVAGGGRIDTPVGKYGAVASFSYDQKWRHRKEYRTIYSLGGGELQKNEEYTLERTDREVGVGGMLTLGGEWGEDQSITSNTFLMRKTRDRTQIADGELTAEYQRSQEYRLAFNRRALLLQQLIGQHKLPLGLGLDWRFLTGEAERELPDRRTYTYNFLGDESYLRSDIGMERKFNTVKDDVGAYSADLTVPLGEAGWLSEAEAKLGISNSSKDRESDTATFSFLPDDEAGVDLTRDPNALFDPEGYGDAFEIRNDTSPGDSYTGSVDVSSRYAMINLELMKALKLNLGVRQEQVDMEVAPEGDNPSSGFKETRTLPGATATWKIREDMNLRFAFSETYSLPMLTEIAPIVYSDPDTGEPFQGNPDLEPVDIRAFDIRWEWYPSNAEMLTLAWFRKAYENPIERSFADLAGGDRTLNQMRNFDQAEVNGFELGARIDLAERLWGPEGLYAQANAAFVDSNVSVEDAGLATNDSRPLQGQAPWIYNLQAGYAGDIWDLTLSYNMVGERLYQAGIQGLPDVYLQPVAYLDLSSRLQFGEHWFLQFKAGNLLDPTIEYTQGGRGYRTYQKGRDFSLSLKWRY
ncbi:TonB-dependent receptor [Thiohalorhabdus methylotrophus]|uniref:TonB-dependent receptor domain-containing protein n=1 Tax=Thiohalorhabdus methylotrophus TaxID=3242694 RepID=A0ABV4TRQ6_9GAMM